MIGFLDGLVAVVTPDGCMLDVNGVGYKMLCPTTTLAALPPEGQRARLWTHVHVREDVLALYGFSSPAEQRSFESLLSVSGVGPKVALAVCSAFDPAALRSAVESSDVAGIASVPGIGKKTAQRIILELKERLAAADDFSPRGDVLAQARSALENLGYSASEVREALGNIGEPADDVASVIRSALKVLA